MQARLDQQLSAFRCIVAVLALIPIGAGAAGIVMGLSFPGFELTTQNADAASHFRFLSGIFLTMGLAYWSVAMQIGNYLHRFQFLALLTIAGGCARLLSLMVDGAPSVGHQLGLAMELLVVPVLLVWSGRLLRFQGQSQAG